MSSLFHRTAFVALAVIALTGCWREERRFSEPGDGSKLAQAKRVSGLQPGPALIDAEVRNPYDTNAFAIAEGKRLYIQMNCVGCHAHGGGAIGPPLMDAQWIYGSDPENIYASIVEGRPNGMPAFAGKLPNQQVWQLVSYVQALSGHVRKDAAPGRADSMHVKQRELAIETRPELTQKAPTP